MRKELLDGDEPQPVEKKKRSGEGGDFGITPVPAAAADSGQHTALLDAWRKKRRKSLARKFLEAADLLCRSVQNTTGELLNDVVKLAQGLARSMAEIRREIEEAFGPELTWLDIENLKRQAEVDRVQRAAAEQWQIIEEGLTADRRRLEEKWELEEERLRELRAQAAGTPTEAFDRIALYNPLDPAIDSMNPYWEPDAYLTELESDDYNIPTPPTQDYCSLQL